MVKKKFYYLFFLLSAITCQTSDESIEEATEKKCYITKFDKKTISFTGQQIYNSELLYNGDKIVAWQDLSWVLTGNQSSSVYEPQIKSVITVEYSNNNLPVKIIEPKDLYGYQYIEYLAFDSFGRISGKERVLTIDNNYESKNVSKYLYDNENKIISVEKKHFDYQNVIDNIQYETWDYENSNLIKRTITNTYNPNYNVSTVITYGNYDTQKNPYANVNVPFEQLLPLKFSKNNYRSYSYKNYVNGSLQSYSSEDISDLNYNENGYPTNKADYNCH